MNARSLVLATLFATCLPLAAHAMSNEITAPPAPFYQAPEAAKEKSAGCISCHTEGDAPSMHVNAAVTLGCADCHGGDPKVMRPAGTPQYDRPPDLFAAKEGAHGPWSPDPRYYAAMNAAHVQPRFPAEWSWPKSAKPKDSYTLLNRESPEFIRFINPSDYRVADEACGACHM